CQFSQIRSTIPVRKDMQRRRQMARPRTAGAGASSAEGRARDQNLKLQLALSRQQGRAERDRATWRRETERRERDLLVDLARILDSPLSPEVDDWFRRRHVTQVSLIPDHLNPRLYRKSARRTAAAADPSDAGSDVEPDNSVTETAPAAKAPSTGTSAGTSGSAPLTASERQRILEAKKSDWLGLTSVPLRQRRPQTAAAAAANYSSTGATAALNSSEADASKDSAAAADTKGRRRWVRRPQSAGVMVLRPHPNEQLPTRRPREGVEASQTCQLSKRNCDIRLTDPVVAVRPRTEAGCVFGPAAIKSGRVVDSALNADETAAERRHKHLQHRNALRPFRTMSFDEDQKQVRVQPLGGQHRALQLAAGLCSAGNVELVNPIASPAAAVNFVQHFEQLSALLQLLVQGYLRLRLRAVQPELPAHEIRRRAQRHRQRGPTDSDSAFRYSSQPVAEPMFRTDQALLQLLVQGYLCSAVLLPPQPLGHEYLGCYVDGGNGDRDLVGNPAFILEASLTLEMCREICSYGRFRYFGTQSRIFCCCGSTYGSKGVAAAADCNYPCTGNTSQECGGDSRNSIYESLYPPVGPKLTKVPVASMPSIAASASSIVYRSVTAGSVIECAAVCQRNPDCLACAFVQSSRSVPPHEIRRRAQRHRQRGPRLMEYSFTSDTPETAWSTNQGWYRGPAGHLQHRNPREASLKLVAGRKQQLYERLHKHLSAMSGSAAPKSDDASLNSDTIDGGHSTGEHGALGSAASDVAALRKEVEQLEIEALTRRRAQLQSELNQAQNHRSQEPPQQDPGRSQCDKKPSRAYLIRDFVKPSSNQPNESLTACMENGNLVFKKQPPSLGKISVGQWIAGNSKILLRLVDDGSLIHMNEDGSKIGELLDSNYSPSVVWEFDEDYRKLISDSDSHRWGCEPPQLYHRHLNDYRRSLPTALSSGSSVNDNYEQEKGLRFASVQDLSLHLSTSSFIGKIDLKQAYRSVGIHPDDQALTGLSWRFATDCEDSVLVDTRLPFGARASCEIFHRLSPCIKRHMLSVGFTATVNYSDDWAVAGDTEEAAQEAFNYLMNLLQNLGFDINLQKTVAPAQQVVFLGVLVDTLCWLSQINRLLRPFLRPLFDIISNITDIRPPSELRYLFIWWRHVVGSLPPTVIRPRFRQLVAIESDSRCEGAAGIVFGSEFNDWTYFSWEKDFESKFRDLHINHKEALGPLLTILRFVEQLRNSRVGDLLGQHCCRRHGQQAVLSASSAHSASIRPLLSSQPRSAPLRSTVSVSALCRLSLAPSSRKYYASHLQVWNEFCRQRQIPATAASESDVCQFVAVLLQRGPASYSRVQSSLSAVSFLHRASASAGPDYGQRPLGSRVSRSPASSEPAASACDAAETQPPPSYMYVIRCRPVCWRLQGSIAGGLRAPAACGWCSTGQRQTNLKERQLEVFLPQASECLLICPRFRTSNIICARIKYSTLVSTQLYQLAPNLKEASVSERSSAGHLGQELRLVCRHGLAAGRVPQAQQVLAPDFVGQRLLGIVRRRLVHLLRRRLVVAAVASLALGHQVDEQLGVVLLGQADHIQRLQLALGQ
uniref:WSC domain-containing protein n=1 Tax=Macrostomum lignano TaxID=282301 RepID=A0A1I8IR21_9PLAT